MGEKKINAEILNTYQLPERDLADKLLAEEAEKSRLKMIVLDDDPTGVQTVHDVSVYTDWSVESMREGFAEENKLFFVLTNSRGFTEEETIKAHREIVNNVETAAREANMEYCIINRSDSTLRGHFPLETKIVKEEMEKRNSWKVDGEILCPYFKEGGRFTLDNVHYVKYGDELVPAGQTEFAKDETFGYISSNLCEYVEEKTKGEFKAEDCITISLKLLRSMDYEEIERKLMSVKNYGKIIVNAIDDIDVKIFCTALYRAIAKGRHYTLRTAAALVKAFGNISDKAYLTREEMVGKESETGGIIVVGSHTAKTTAQLNELKNVSDITFIELNSDLVLEEGKLEEETVRVLGIIQELIRKGMTVCVSTKRALLKVENDTPEEALKRSVKISDALQKCVGELKVTPAFVVAKGGITSSDVGVKALKVKRAKVLGQIRPGIPVWKTGAESKFPGIPYVIFPGNVGEIVTLREAVEILMNK